MLIYSATLGTMELDSRYWIDTPGATTLDNITRALGPFDSRCSVFSLGGGTKFSTATTAKTLATEDSAGLLAKQLNSMENVRPLDKLREETAYHSIRVHVAKAIVDTRSLLA